MSYQQTKVDICTDDTEIKKPPMKIITLKQTSKMEPGRKFNVMGIV